MRTVTGKKIGQSGPELFSAALFSFLLHVFVLFAAFFLFELSTPRTFTPPVYRVTLVGQPSEVPPLPSAAPAPEQKQPEKKAKPAPKRAKAPAKKGAMPELASKKKAEPERPAEEAAPEEKKAEAAKTGSVAVSAPQEFPFAPYLMIVRDKIEMNWNPPPTAKDAKATVVFRVNRSGRVIDVGLKDPSGNFYFDQAANRSILMSSPFPPLPEGYFKDTMEFSVDLIPKE